ncbi:class IIc cyclic bacteriocin [Rathayibacter rathayi]|uniref:class IIc cyclic bacteriocin n=1 Tax=Rathayibacter rathayi TaxID=33887 RepID=UPI0011AFE25E|nr:class IIc cyclic bacteriocin [Rathayibacter rathayi]
MSPIPPGESYTNELALGIHEESLRFRRKVRSSVLSNAVVVLVAAIVFGVFSVTQSLQRDLPAATSNPELVMAPASGSALTTAFSALLAVILAVWFAPTTFRLGASEAPSTIARELASKSIVAAIARICVLLSLSVTVWSYWSSAVSDGPYRVPIMRMILPALLGIGFAYWAAAAEMRLGELSNDNLLWAERHREVERLKQVIAGEPSSALSWKVRVSQQFIAFVLVPVVLWILGLLIVPSPNETAALARLLTIVVVNTIGYFALSELIYRLIGRKVAAAAGLVFALVLVGTLLSLATTTAAFSSGVVDDAFHIGPIARSMLLFTVIVLSGPFVILAVFAARLPGRRWRGVIFDSAMNRYAKELTKAEEVVASTATKQTNRSASSGEAVKPFAWLGLVALLPIAPFNVMFGVLALRLIRDGRARGRAIVTAAIIIGVAMTGIGVCALIHAVFSDPTVVFCDPDSKAACIR